MGRESLNKTDAIRLPFLVAVALRGGPAKQEKHCLSRSSGPGGRPPVAKKGGGGRAARRARQAAYVARLANGPPPEKLVRIGRKEEEFDCVLGQDRSLGN